MNVTTKSRIFRLVLSCSSLVCICSCDSLAQQPVLGNIVGEIHVLRAAFPPKQVMISLQSRGATITSKYADDQGRFGFPYLPAGSYNVVVDDDDYAPVNVRVELNPVFSQTAQVQITLIPREVTKPDGAAGRVSGSNPNAIDLSEYTRKFPKKAVSEYEKGLKANSSGNSDSALHHFQKSVELAADFYPAHNELGRVYTTKSDFPAAQHEFEEAIRLNQSDAEAHLNLGNVFLLTKKYDDALRSVQEGLRREPSSAVGQFTLGSIYERTGKFADAEKALRTALELDPKMTKVHLELVNLYLFQKRKPEAASELKAFLKDSPDDPFAPKAREVLKKLDQ
jgi:Flp pilus assembly protein TadD